MVEVARRAVSADLLALVAVANNNGTASADAWARIRANPVYVRLEANLEQSKACLATLEALKDV